MDRWLDPGVSFVQPRAERVSYAAMMKKLAVAYPGQQITEMDLAGPDASVIAKMSGQSRAFVDPYTGRILGTRPGEPPSFWLRHVHRELAGGNVGAQVVRVMTVILFVQSLSGLYLWWPIKRMTVKWSSTWRRINFDLHYAVGFFSSVFVCIIAATGLIKGYGDELQPFFDSAAGEPAGKKALVSQRPETPAADSRYHDGRCGCHGSTPASRRHGGAAYSTQGSGRDVPGHDEIPRRLDCAGPKLGGRRPL